MAKRLFLLFIICFIEVATLPIDLAATDDYVSLAPDFDAVLTEPLSEPVSEPVEEPTQQLQFVSNLAAPATGLAVANNTVNYAVTIYSGEMVAHNLSYSDIYKTGKLIYGHNSGNLLGNLAGLSIGQTITITESGVVGNYQVMDMATYEKTADGFLNGDKYLMGRIMKTALGYDAALMTCAGVSYGNGDASHRLVVFVNAV